VAQLLQSRRGVRFLRYLLAVVSVIAIVIFSIALGRRLMPSLPRRSAREIVLARQNQELIKLKAEADKGTLLDFKGVLIVVDQVLVQDLLRAVTPLDAEVGGGFHVRIRSVDSGFGDGVALVRLTGQASVAGASVGTDVTVFAAIDVVRLDPASGMLQCGVNILGIDAQNATALGRNDPIGRLTEALTDGGLALLLGPLEIPISLEDRLEMPAVQSKRLQIPAETLPLSVAAREVKVFGGRLWIFVDVALVPRPPTIGVPVVKS
jgi:hypothetical protein